ncbi:phosphohydrolase [Salipaludibacillus neizhouensis]|uniref:Phosphohydrolase n=1 Tax=Salipaludibacillus neizhouensis TaxID=885475 RepID=A0A3A9KAF6_9BACI|nr:HD domain-containing protein [Salipaludibacillus neizhouensis]RKL69189.1 phosphohydrolase [Salipaludibacillus neizhouensis]
MDQLIQKAETWVQKLFEKDSSGHDWYHTDRVRKNARMIAQKEEADLFICELASLLHDAGDDKFHESEESGRIFVVSWLEKENVPYLTIKQVMAVIDTVSFKGGNNRQPDTIEGKIVQDADRLDAIGAVGIARTFMYAGNKGDAMHIPDKSHRTEMTKKEYREGTSTSINHFYEKLLTLSALMKTKTGKDLAKKRHEFLELYLEQFHEEWEGKR